MNKFHKMELKSPLNSPFPKGEAPIPLPFVKGGGEGLFLFQKAKFIRILQFRIHNSQLAFSTSHPLRR